MTDREQTQPEPDESREAADDQGGVFGNLPGTAPGSAQPAARQSSLRPGEQARSRAPLERPGRSLRPPSRPDASAPAPEPETPPATGTAARRRRGPRLGGIAVAAEAATLGVRLLSRAVEAVREPADRR